MLFLADGGISSEAVLLQLIENVQNVYRWLSNYKSEMLYNLNFTYPSAFYWKSWFLLYDFINYTNTYLYLSSSRPICVNLKKNIIKSLRNVYDEENIQLKIITIIVVVFAY